ncbi:hypothetical protein PV327_006136 [Microctonus hyperodae]|uniref:BRCT domain-containing protein n=1 Tax=Microctonus hyperodae TaxID=165561 RepID=A0AA39L0F7_MICHY|nr:hypothetical protein PV327_006136 [Microctonus hyperodae]
MNKNTINKIEAKQENGDANIEQNLGDTTIENNPMTTESQDFHLVDSVQSQLTQLNSTEHKKSLMHSSSITSDVKWSNIDDKQGQVCDLTIKAVQDGGVYIIDDENKVMIEAERRTGEEMSSCLTNDDDDDYVPSTPLDQLFSSPNRQLLGTPGPHKRKIDDSNESLVKISRSTEGDIIPETPESSHDDNQGSSAAVNVNLTPDTPITDQKKIINTNENNIRNINDTNIIIPEDEDKESFHVLSRTLENVIGDGEQMEINENTMTMKKKPKEFTTNDGIIIKSQVDEPKIIRSIKNFQDPLDKTNNLKNDDKFSHDTNSKKSRMSIEVIYDKSLEPSVKSKELVEIDEEGEKIVLDSSQEYPSLNDSDISTEKKDIINSHQLPDDSQKIVDNMNDNKMINGNQNAKSNNNLLQNASTDFITDSDRSTDSRIGALSTVQKIPELLNLISDSEEDSFLNEEKAKIKMTPIEKEIGIFIKVKCLLHVDEMSKDIISKEIISALCESAVDFQSSRMRNCSTLGLADISDGKDSASPGSVTSNPRPYPLNSRFSTMSMVSSSSSSSSGSFKLPLKDNVQFSLPRGVPKHAKKTLEPQIYDDMIEKLKKEWKNVNALTTSLLNFLNNELLTIDIHNGTVETTNNTSEHFRSSTPEAPKENSSTSKSSEKVKLTKRKRKQNFHNSSSNGVTTELKHSQKVIEKIQEATNKKQDDDSTNESSTSMTSTTSRQSTRSLNILKNQTPVHGFSDTLIGKQCFAKWGDNNYYPGIVVSRSKTKLRINFLDGLNKLLMEDFVVIIPSILPVGLSVYASVENDPYGSCGIITGVDNSNSVILYNVETDEREKLKVSIRDIFLTTDQVLILKETMNDDIGSPSTTPQLGKITLDNVVVGNRRNESSISTPKSTRSKSRGNTIKRTMEVRASGSGVLSKIHFEDSSDSDLKTSDSNTSRTDDNGLGTIQMEIVGNSNDYASKGPQNRLKGKARSKKRVDDQETIALLGPIPEEGSTLFKGINFILTCASLDLLDRYKLENKGDFNSESGTDLEQEWNKTPFVRERLTAQIIAGGGKIYEKFDDIPINEYGITKLITNVPNITAKSLQCLSVGIHSWNHQYIIRSCLNNKLVNHNQEKLPAGWSLDRNSYIEMSERPNDKPFNHLIIAVPKMIGVEESTKFWAQIIENAGGTVRLIENQSDNLLEATAILTNRKCPNWIVQHTQNENIPLVSTTWIIQCLIAGSIISHESQTAYFHYNMK